MVASSGYSGAVILPSTPSIALTTGACSNPSGDNKTWPIANGVKRYLDPNYGSAPIVQTELDEIQTLTMTGGPTGGNFTLTFGGNTTANIPWNATAAQVQTALQALASIGAGNVLCTGGPLPATPVAVEFTGTLGFANQATMAESSLGLTGGTSPQVNVAVTQNGQVFTTISSTLYTIQWLGAVVIFNTALLGASVGVRFFTGGGGYFPWTVLANITLWGFDGQTTFQDNTSIQGDGLGGLSASAGYKTFQPLLLEGTFTVTKWWVPTSQDGFSGDITNGTLFIISGVMMSGNRYEGYAYAKKDSIKSDVQKLTDSSLDFQFSGQFYCV
jgi:hypothetical protein